VVETEHAADFIEEFRLLTSRSVKHIELPTERLETTDNGPQAKLPDYFRVGGDLRHKIQTKEARWQKGKVPSFSDSVVPSSKF
jgi:hypothetical protein